MTSQVREEQLACFFCFPFWHTLCGFNNLVSLMVGGFLCGGFVVPVWQIDVYSEGIPGNQPRRR